MAILKLLIQFLLHLCTLHLFWGPSLSYDLQSIQIIEIASVKWWFMDLIAAICLLSLLYLSVAMYKCMLYLCFCMYLYPLEGKSGFVQINQSINQLVWANCDVL